MKLSKLSILPPLQILLLLTLLGSCGRTYRLPPLPGPGVEQPEATNASTDCQTGQKAADDQCKAEAKNQEVRPQDPMTAQIFAYLKGKKIGAYVGDKASACFENFGAPCKGTYRNLKGEIKVMNGEACELERAEGKVTIFVVSAQGDVMFEMSVTEPKSYFPVPNVMGDDKGKFVMNDAACKL
jgi:hypothetical protein